MSVPQDAFDRVFEDLLRPISPLLDRGGVTEIMVNAPDQIYVEERGRVVRTSLRFSSEDDLLALLRALSQFAGGEVGPRSPILEARLPDGSRVQGVVPPVSVDGPLLSIRRHAVAVSSAESLVELGALDPNAVDVLRQLVEARQNILVAGPPGSGKTTLLAVLAQFISAEDRVLLVEDPSELSLPLPHVVRLEAQSPRLGRATVTVGDLLRLGLRFRPDRIVLGEVDDRGAFDFVQAILAGHVGCFTTLNAVRPGDALARLEAMTVTGSSRLDASIAKLQVANAVDAIVLLGRSPDGVRHVSSVCRVTGIDRHGRYRIESLHSDSVGSPIEAGP